MRAKLQTPKLDTRHSTFDTHLPKQNQKKKPPTFQKKNSKTITAWVDLNRQATKVAGNAAPGTPIEKLGDNYVTKVFDQAKDAGFNLVRVFGHGEETSFMLQTSPGNYDERIFRGLDYIIAVAGSRGVRVLFVPINMWLSPHVGDGFGTYVEWAGYPVSQSVSRGFFRFLFPSRAIRTLLLRRRLLLPLSRARARAFRASRSLPLVSITRTRGGHRGAFGGDSRHAQQQHSLFPCLSLSPSSLSFSFSLFLFSLSLFSLFPFSLPLRSLSLSLSFSFLSPSSLSFPSLSLFSVFLFLSLSLSLSLPSLPLPSLPLLSLSLSLSLFSLSPVFSLPLIKNLNNKKQDKFWTDGRIKGMVKNHFQTLLNRRNVFSGLQWKEDPAIFGMDLFNEPRLVLWFLFFPFSGVVSFWRERAGEKEPATGRWREKREEQQRGSCGDDFETLAT